MGTAASAVTEKSIALAATAKPMAEAPRENVVIDVS